MRLFFLVIELDSETSITFLTALASSPRWIVQFVGGWGEERYELLGRPDGWYNFVTVAELVKRHD